MDLAAVLIDQIVHLCPEGIILNDPQGNILLFNDAAERIFGYSRDEVVGKMHVSALYPAAASREVKIFLHSNDYGGKGRLIDYETEILHKDGRKVPIRLSCTALHEDGRETGVVGFFTDISTKKALEQEFIESEERFRGIVETASDAIISFDEDRAIVMVNEAAETLLGYTKNELLGMNFRRLIPAKYGDNWEQIERYAAAGGPFHLRKYIELSALGKPGREIPVQMSMAEKRVRGRRIVTVIIRDISARKAMEEELRILSVTDTLTQLYNRRQLASLARKETDRARRTKVPFALIMIDVDRFKQFNDTFGHTEGDKVLQKTGRVILDTFRTMDSAFRFGGEEFVVLLPEADAAGALAAAERLRVRFSETEFFPSRDGGPVRLTLSIGIAQFREDDTHEDMIRFADLAMYAAKNQGRNRCICYDHAANRPATAGGPGD